MSPLQEDIAILIARSLGAKACFHPQLDSRLEQTVHSSVSLHRSTSTSKDHKNFTRVLLTMGIEGLCCVASQHIAAAAATTPAQSSNPSSSIPAKHPRPEVLISHDFGWTNGQTLRIGFLDGDDWQKGQVRQYAVEWCRYANLTFAFDPPLNSPCEILISFMEPGSWSQLGTYSLLKTALPIPEASMNFGWMWYGVPEEDLRATILHEFGHALGLVHEHQYWWSQLYGMSQRCIESTADRRTIGLTSRFEPISSRDSLDQGS